MQHLSDPNINDWFGSLIRGGVAFIKTRYEKRDSVFKGLGHQKLTEFLDATNFYGPVMTFEFPYDDFTFVGKPQLSLLKQKLIR